jgi:hypothetical protein
MHYSEKEEELLRMRQDEVLKSAYLNQGSLAAVKPSGAVAPKALQTQVGGTHYSDMAIQPAAYNLANNMGWAEGDAISYISRWRKKGGLQDLRKARQTLLLLIEHEEALGTE